MSFGAVGAFGLSRARAVLGRVSTSAEATDLLMITRVGGGLRNVSIRLASKAAPNLSIQIHLNDTKPSTRSEQSASLQHLVPGTFGIEKYLYMTGYVVWGSKDGAE